jgi:hypothetical protein
LYKIAWFTTLPLSIPTQAFASEVIAFDTDSSFWVCNDWATGHICKNKSLFSGEMVPLIDIVGAAMGTTETTLMGTVVLCTTDDNGKKHVFTLTHVNYIPNLPINLLSTRVLGKQYVDENDFDKQGTGVWSAYDTHVLIWDHGRYSKTFKTHSSGLPECLFNSGYSCLNTSTPFLIQHYDNSINWAFCSALKNNDLAASNDGAGVAIIQGNGDMTLKVPMTLENTVAFLQNMKLRYNNGLGTQDIV